MLAASSVFKLGRNVCACFDTALSCSHNGKQIYLLIWPLTNSVHRKRFAAEPMACNAASPRLAMAQIGPVEPICAELEPAPNKLARSTLKASNSQNNSIAANCSAHLRLCGCIPCGVLFLWPSQVCPPDATSDTRRSSGGRLSGRIRRHRHLHLQQFSRCRGSGRLATSNARNSRPASAPLRKRIIKSQGGEN